jgi:hypothetical protein
MTNKHIYTSNEIPDNQLQEFDDITEKFLLFILSLSDNHHPTAIHAGWARAHIDFLRMASGENFKQVLLNTAEYFTKAAEKLEENK